MLTLASGVLSMLGRVRVKHQTHYTGRRVFPVHASGVSCLQLRFSDKAPDAPEWVPCSAFGVSEVCRPLCA
jgi:hypothetical protein